MANGGVNFFQSQAPDKYVPEKPKAEPSEIERLQQKISEMEEANKKNSAEAHRKISELTQSTQFLNQTILDLVSQKQAVPQPPAEKPKESTDWDAVWRQQFGAPPQKPADPPAKEGEEVKPEEISQVVRQEFGKMYEEGERAKANYMEQERQLMEKFRNEEKELHPYAEQVVELYKTIAQANPNMDLPTRYNLAVEAAKRTLLKGSAPKAPSGHGGNSDPQHPSRQQPAGEPLVDMNFTGNFRQDLQAERDRELERRKSLEQSTGWRKQLQAQRMGLSIQQS